VNVQLSKRRYRRTGTDTLAADDVHVESILVYLGHIWFMVPAEAEKVVRVTGTHTYQDISFFVHLHSPGPPLFPSSS